ncbi:DUF317 domain-containing protein [Streptomyces sp. NBC_01351]|uniref:DUF317 domain-containing protein n=1 Tax=Streptomyces sp. NBC_01351 TaxID=2903833 RepID=UPI002E2F82CD|nr:DUF317 domain-containing protein [Streptomyces sp. NBC_01351]
MPSSAPQAAATVDGDVYVTPRYLAGSPGYGDAGFAPVKHWPHHHLDEGPHQLVITSPDHRIRIGWAGDDYDLWTISAAPDAVSGPQWTAIVNQNTPPELVAALTTALARDWADGQDRFLAAPSAYWADSLAPLVAAGWQRTGAEVGTVELTAPDSNAGVYINRSRRDLPDGTELWAGPPGWGTRAEITFSPRTPSHLIAATAEAFTETTPVARWQQGLHRQLAALAQLTPVVPPRPPVPTPRDLRPRIGVRPPVAVGSVPRWSTATTPSAALPARGAVRR